MDEDLIRITLRLPSELHAKLQKSSEQTSHSMNAEIIARLTQSYKVGTDLGIEQLEGLADIVAEKVVARLAEKQR